MNKYIFILRLVGLLFGYGFLTKVWQILTILRLQAISRDWYPATAQVVARDYEYTRHNNGLQAYRMYYIYRYPAWGQQFEKKVWLGTLFNLDRALAALREIKTTLAIRFNPDKPEQLITERDVLRQEDFGALIIFLVVAILLFLIPMQ